MPNWVGDCMMATPALDYLRQAFPNAEIDAMIRPTISQTITSNRAITAVISADDRKMPDEEMRRLKARRYDLAVLLPNSFRSGWLAVRLGIPRRVGYARSGRSLLLTCRVPHDKRRWRTPTPKPLSKLSIKGDPAATKPEHMIFFYLQLAIAAARRYSEMAPPVPPREQIKLSMPLMPEAVEEVRALLKAKGLDDTARIAAVNPGAAYGSAKRWPLDRLAKVAEGLAGEGYAIVSTCSRFEPQQNDELTRLAKVPIHRIGEQVDLPGIAAILDRADVYVTNDSGPMHMAAAQGTPTVAVFGPTDWNVTHPWQESYSIVRNTPECSPCFLRECPIDHRCMLSIDTAEVLKEALRLARAPRGTQ